MMALMASLPVAAVQVNAICAFVNRRFCVINNHLSLVQKMMRGSCSAFCSSTVMILLTSIGRDSSKEPATSFGVVATLDVRVLSRAVALR